MPKSRAELDATLARLLADAVLAELRAEDAREAAERPAPPREGDAGTERDAAPACGARQWSSGVALPRMSGSDAWLGSSVTPEEMR